MAIWAPADPAPEPPLDATTGSPRANSRWSLPTRIAFRFAFCYLGGYCLFSGNATLVSLVPIVGYQYQDVLARIFQLPAQSLAKSLFHVAPPGNQIHPTGSGDTAIHWIAVLLLLCASIVATAIWSLLDRGRPNYRTLNGWLRFLVRFTVAVGMVAYGMDKVFPLQMSAPAISSLSEPLGMHSPMSYLWEFIGLHPLYEMICGAAEMLGGLLLLFRRTALAGALLSAFVVTNVLLYNLFFDVPVKLYAGHLLLLCVLLILPDVRPLLSFFWSHQPAAPAAPWVPLTTRRWLRRTIFGVEIAVGIVLIGGSLLGNSQYWRRYRKIATAQCVICRPWKLDPAANNLPSPFNGGAVELAIDSTTRAIVSDAMGKASAIPIQIDAAHHTLEFDGPEKRKSLFLVEQPDANHLRLTPIGRTDETSAIALTDMTPPGGYLLMTRGFHWISEYPYLH